MSAASTVVSGTTGNTSTQLSLVLSRGKLLQFPNDSDEPFGHVALVGTAAHLLNREDVLPGLHDLPFEQANGAVIALYIDHAERIEQRNVRTLVDGQMVIGVREANRPYFPQLAFAVIDCCLRQSERLRV